MFTHMYMLISQFEGLWISSIALPVQKKELTYEMFWNIT